MLTWATLRTQVRRSILKEPTALSWSDDVLLDLCGWALDTFCAHTALVTGVTVSAPLTTTIPQPTDIFSNLETTGLLYLRTASEVCVVPPALQLPYTDTQEITYSVWGSNILLSCAPSPTKDLVIRYFATYPHPVADSDAILIPTWGVNALAHLIGALAQTSLAVQSAGIDRWKDKKDSGNPEDNALRIQQSHLFKIYDAEMARFRPQVRENYYQKLLPL